VSGERKYLKEYYNTVQRWFQTNTCNVAVQNKTLCNSKIKIAAHTKENGRKEKK
jgi:hypothetical protein